MPKIVHTEEPCPVCGHPVDQLVTKIGDVTYVDRYCSSCEWRDEDTEGGT